MAEPLAAGPTAPEPLARAGTAPSRPGGLDPFVAAIAVGQVISWGVLYYAFSVLLVPMQQDLGWSRPVLVGGFTLAVVTSGLLAPTVGCRLDHGNPRLVMGGGSAVAAVLVVAWSQTRSTPAYYAVWAAIGVAMALVLYEPAFTVIAKRYAPRHHRPLTAVTLIAGTSSFFFQPFTGAWRRPTAGASLSSSSPESSPPSRCPSTTWSWPGRWHPSAPPPSQEPPAATPPPSSSSPPWRAWPATSAGAACNRSATVCLHRPAAAP